MKEIATDIELCAPVETRRDQWGRYKVVPPEGGKAVGYTRATTIAKTLDDTSNLMSWSSRMVAIGLAQRPDLLAQVAVLPADDRKTLNALCEKAKEAGGATVRRDLGTAIHEMFQRSCEDSTFTPPAPYMADLAAIHRALIDAELTLIGMHERIVVNDTHRIAGTFDLLAETADGRIIVADLKTGSSVKYGGLGFAIQLAIYATADALYTQGYEADGSGDVREAMPDIDRTQGLIIHCQPGSGVCDLHWVDLTTGIEALDLALKVRELRRLNPLIAFEPTPAEILATVDAHFPGTVDVTPTEHVDDAWRSAARERLTAIIDAGGAIHVRDNWPPDVPTLKTGLPITMAEGELIDSAISYAEKVLGLPFPADPTPTPQPRSRPEPVDVRPIPDEGGIADDLVIAKLKHDMAALDDAAKSWVKHMIDMATAKSRPINLGGDNPKTERRAAVYSALIALAPHDDDELVRAVLSLAIGEEIQPTVHLGEAFGSLTIDESRTAVRIVEAIETGAVTPVYQDSGVTFAGDISAVTAA